MTNTSNSSLVLESEESITGDVEERNLRILHVTACFAGGVSRAIRATVDLAPNHDHHLLASGSDVTPDAVVSFKSVRKLPQTLKKSILGLRRAVKELDIDVVHAHSSWAGFYSRILPLSVPVVYQPHCYAFEMPGLVRKILYGAAEVMLGPRTACVVVLSQREKDLAERFTRNSKYVYIPNVPSIPIKASVNTDIRLVKKVITSGRICSQKDPGYFQMVAQEVNKLNSEVQFVWVGDGDSDMRSKLEDAGVRVTGWLNSEEIVSEFDESSVYIHTAKYEGFPLSVLDAAARGLPIAVRKIPAFNGTSLISADTVDGLASIICSTITDSVKHHQLVTQSSILLATMNNQYQSRALNKLYQLFSNNSEMPIVR